MVLAVSMGPVAVATMVQGVTAEQGQKKVHPFFTKPTPAPGPSTPSAESPIPEITRDEDPAGESVEGDAPRKRRKTDTAVPDDGTPKKRQRKKRSTEGADGSILNHVSREGGTETKTDMTLATQKLPDGPIIASTSEASHVPQRSEPEPKTTETPAPPPNDPEPTKPKKILKFNAMTGTLGSPPRPKKKPSPTRIVTIKYGHDTDSRNATGEKIRQILDGEMQIPITPTKKRTRGPAKSKETSASKDAAPKSTHPFFGGKPLAKSGDSKKPSDSPKKSPRQRHSVFMSTPVSPKKPRVPFPTDKLPHFGMRTGGTKVPGAMHPMWPAQGLSHIRGVDLPRRPKPNDNLGPMARKFKGHIVSVPTQESVVKRVLDEMNLAKVRESLPRDQDAFEPAPTELRLPRRHFRSGKKLQKMIRSQLRTYRSRAVMGLDESEDELSKDSHARVHPAICRFFDSLGTQLSAFDRSRCESLAWTQKYAPATAAEVLQGGKDVLLLKQWLEALKVQSVDTGDASGKSKGKPEAVKKKRKKNKLDGFIVDSDDEADEMDEVSEAEDDLRPAVPGRQNKTVIRSGDMTRSSKDPGRLTNAVLISGPHGVGKSAAVYAVAKELGFEIFEINSSSRRSGKDILDRVGDMTRNHLVQHRQADADSAASTLAEGVAEEVQSGKQGTMTSFFKPKPDKKKPATKKPDEQAPIETKSAIPKSQKQSLILLEEVDVLYEEDKQFWATVMSLIVQSKRPFIMTCNDESLVPIQSLSLHGIFRFAHPPVDLAVDLCLLIAASEGHALQRTAVKALYESRCHDLRATITDLNYWCQIGVGDRRGGFDWFFLRWPKGSDLDENGDVVRVISEDTYVPGMGWFGRDPIADAPDAQRMEEEAMRQAWHSWDLDMGDWDSYLDLQSWSSSNETAPDRQSKIATLDRYEEYCDSLSNSDLCACGGFASGSDQGIDPSLPEIPSKTRDDFILGRTLIDAQPLTRQVSPNVAVSMSIKSLAKSRLMASTKHAPGTGQPSVLGAVDEAKAVSTLESSFKDHELPLARYDISLAFDPIATSDKSAQSTSLDPSVFDRTLKLIVLDVAPWVRGVVQYDNRLMQERLKLSSLLSEGGGGGGKRKRMRNTRAAYSALEGGERRTTRRERYFGDGLVTGLVMRTAGEGWGSALMELQESQARALAQGEDQSELECVKMDTDVHSGVEVASP